MSADDQKIRQEEHSIAKDEADIGEWQDFVRSHQIRFPDILNVNSALKFREWKEKHAREVTVPDNLYILYEDAMFRRSQPPEHEAFDEENNKDKHQSPNNGAHGGQEKEEGKEGLSKDEKKRLDELRKKPEKTRAEQKELIDLTIKQRQTKKLTESLKKKQKAEADIKRKKAEKKTFLYKPVEKTKQEKELEELLKLQEMLGRPGAGLSIEEQNAEKELYSKYSGEPVETKREQKTSVKETGKQTQAANEYIKSFTAVQGVEREPAKFAEPPEDANRVTEFINKKFKHQETPEEELQRLKNLGFNKKAGDLLRITELERQFAAKAAQAIAKSEEIIKNIPKPGPAQVQQLMGDVEIEERKEDSFKKNYHTRTTNVRSSTSFENSGFSTPQLSSPHPRSGWMDKGNKLISKGQDMAKALERLGMRIAQLALRLFTPPLLYVTLTAIILIIIVLVFSVVFINGSSGGPAPSPAPFPSTPPSPSSSPQEDNPDISIACQPAKAKVGDPIQCSITVVNRKSSSQKITLTYYIPLGQATVDSSSTKPPPSEVDKDSGVIVWNLSLGAGATQTVTFTLKASQDNTAIAILGTAQYDGSQGASQANTNICIGDTGNTTCTGNSSGLSLTFTEAPDQVSNGDQISYKLTGKNEGTDPIDFTIVDAVPDNATAVGPKQQDFANVEPGGTRDFLITLTPKGIDTYIFNFACIMITGSGGTCVNPNSFITSPNNNDCNGAYSLTNPEGNFGDQNCELLTSDDVVNKLYPLLQSLDPKNADTWLAVARAEASGGYPHHVGPGIDGSNSYLQNSQSGKGAFGLYQMNPQGRGNGQYDVGDVNWRQQAQNAINYYYKVLDASGFCYWQNFGPCAPF